MAKDKSRKRRTVPTGRQPRPGTSNGHSDENQTQGHLQGRHNICGCTWAAPHWRFANFALDKCRKLHQGFIYHYSDIKHPHLNKYDPKPNSNSASPPPSDLANRSCSTHARAASYLDRRRPRIAKSRSLRRVRNFNATYVAKQIFTDLNRLESKQGLQLWVTGHSVFTASHSLASSRSTKT